VVEAYIQLGGLQTERGQIHGGVRDKARDLRRLQLLQRVGNAVAVRRACNGRVMRQRWFVASRRSSMTFAPLVSTMALQSSASAATSAVLRQSPAVCGKI